MSSESEYDSSSHDTAASPTSGNTPEGYEKDFTTAGSDLNSVPVHHALASAGSSNIQPVSAMTSELIATSITDQGFQLMPSRVPTAPKPDLPAGPGAKVHNAWEQMNTHTAKCDFCQRNKIPLNRCNLCNLQVCSRQQCIDRLSVPPREGAAVHGTSGLNWNFPEQQPTSKKRNLRKPRKFPSGGSLGNQPISGSSVGNLGIGKMRKKRALPFADPDDNDESDYGIGESSEPTPKRVRTNYGAESLRNEAPTRHGHSGIESRQTLERRSGNEPTHTSTREVRHSGAESHQATERRSGDQSSRASIREGRRPGYVSMEVAQRLIEGHNATLPGHAPSTPLNTSAAKTFANHPPRAGMIPNYDPQVPQMIPPFPERDHVNTERSDHFSAPRHLSQRSHVRGFTDIELESLGFRPASSRTVSESLRQSTGRVESTAHLPVPPSAERHCRERVPQLGLSVMEPSERLWEESSIISQLRREGRVPQAVKILARARGVPDNDLFSEHGVLLEHIWESDKTINTLRNSGREMDARAVMQIVDKRIQEEIRRWPYRPFVFQEY